MCPVGDGGDSCVQGLQGAPQGSGVDVICGVFGGDPGEDSRPVTCPCYLGGEPADRSLPHVAVSVDEARNDEPTVALDHFGVWIGPFEFGSDVDDNPVANEDVTVGLVPEGRIHGDDVAIFDQEFSGHGG